MAFHIVRTVDPLNLLVDNSVVFGQFVEDNSGVGKFVDNSGGFVVEQRSVWWKLIAFLGHHTLNVCLCDQQNKDGHCENAFPIPGEVEFPFEVVSAALELAQRVVERLIEDHHT